MPALVLPWYATARRALCLGAEGALGVITGLLALSGVARAECPAAGADLSWVRTRDAESCPAPAVLRAEVGRRLGKVVGSTPGTGKVIEAVVERTARGWSVRIAMSGCGSAPATRVIESDAATCAPIASAATLVLALAIDPAAALAPPGGDPTAPVPSPTPNEAASPDTPAPPPVSPKPPRPVVLTTLPDAAIEARTTLRGLVTFGLVPRVAPAIAWSSEWRVPPWLVLDSGVLHVPEQPAADPTYSFGMTAGWVGACADLLRFSGLALAPCARLLAGSIHAILRTHPTIVGTDPGQRAWGGASLGARLTARLVGPLQAEVGGDLLAPITRHEFVLRNDPRPIFRQAPVTGALFLGVGVAFP